MERALGIDIHPDYQKTFQYQGNLDFIMLQMVNGTAEQEGLEKIWPEVAKVPRRFGYHYVRSDWSFSAQLDAFLGVCEKYPVHGFMVDFEGKGNTRSIEFCNRARKMVDALSERKPTLFYSNPKYIQEWMLAWDIKQCWLRDNPEKYPLHIAQYPYREWNDALATIQEPDTWQPRLPAGFTDWKFWQFSADGNKKGPEYGVFKLYSWQQTPSVDLNVFNGTVEELDEWLGIAQDEPEVPPVGESCEELQLKARNVLDKVWELMLAAEEMQVVLDQ